jgi:phosphoribosylaminoimidazolecarboxamide formyltransferase/IMP cyclohydrolase
MRSITKEIASHIHTIFAEIICAPSFSAEALQILQTKKNIRLLKRIQPNLTKDGIRSAGAGVLIQDRDMQLASEMTIKAGRELTKQEVVDVYFGIKIVKHVKSNAIVVVKDSTTLGICGGQPNRINSTMMSLKQAGEKAIGAILISDAYFPFADSVQAAHQAGIKIVVEPGGSIRDPEIIDEAKKHDIILVFTGLRHFLH